MAAYTCTLFTNTGFNTINIPDSPALVNGMSSITVPALDINQERFLPSVRVRATWAQVKDADYCKVGDFYYTINSISMTSQDVAEISLTPDYITSAGGPGSLEILDGLTNRVHVSDDSFGIYSADDPYMAPAYDMDIVSAIKQFSDTSKTFVETTLNLFVLGSMWHSGALEAFTAKDKYAQDQGYAEVPEVTVPVVKYLEKSTNYKCNLFGANFDLQGVKNQGIYELGIAAMDPTISAGINVARSLGIEQSISGQYAIPSDLISVVHGDTHIPPDAAFCTEVSGAGGEITSWSQGLTPSFVYGTAQNNRVWYGSQSKYTLISATGDSITANAEEVYLSGDSLSAAPTVRYWCDPRRTGKPYFRFATMNGMHQRYDLFRGAISGKQWNNVPLVLTEKSGGLLDKVNYSASVAQRDLADTMQSRAEHAQLAGAGLGIVGSVVSGITDPLHMSNAVGGLVGTASGLINNMMESQNYWEKGALDRAMEKEQFQIKQNFNVPTINFPIDPDLFCEFLRNGCMLCRTIYKAADVQRIDKILTAFGYQHTKVLEASDFTNRQKFNYVEGSISVGNLPKWWADGIAAQMRGGVRVWHIKPTHTAYSSNPIA